MPLSPDEQRILDEIGNVSPRRIPAGRGRQPNLPVHASLGASKWSLLAFLVGFLMLMVFLMVLPDRLWVAATGFGVMLAAALLIYRYLKQLTLDQMRAMQQQSGRFSLTGLLARLAGRFERRRRHPGS